MALQLSACAPPDYCDSDPQTTLPTLRLSVRSTTNVSLDSVARVARIDAGGALSEFVGIASLARIDPGRLGGRSAMQLAVTAPGHERQDISLPRDCDNLTPRLIPVILSPAP
jgi:hypothetical protein